ncbi:VPS9 domain-containing protein [Entamoeba marina]
MDRPSRFSIKSWRKSNDSQPTPSISPPVELDMPGEFIYQQEYEELLTSFAKQFGMPYVPINLIHNTITVDRSPQIIYLLTHKIGLQAVVTALEHDFTLIIPNKTMTLTPEYLMTHMIRKKPHEDTFVTFNGLYGKITNDSIALFSDQEPAFPWKCIPDIFLIFQNIFMIIWKVKKIWLGEQKKQLGSCCNFTEAPLIFNGCSWGWVNDELQRGYLWMERPSVSPLNGNISNNPKWYQLPSEPQEHSGNTFLEKLDQSKAIQIRSSLENSFKQFRNISNTLQFKEKSVFLKQMITGTKRKIERNDVWKNSFIEEEENIMECLENIYTISLYELLWPPCFEETSKDKGSLECREKDKKLEDFVLSRQFLNATDIGLEFLHDIAESVIEEVAGLLRQVNMKRSPKEKGKVLKDVYEVVKGIVDYLTDSNEETYIKTLAFIILKTNISFLVTTLDYIKAFRLTTQENWIFDVVKKYELAIDQIMNLNVNNVKLPHTSFSSLFTKAKKKAQNPIGFTDYFSIKPKHPQLPNIDIILNTDKPEDLTKEEIEVLLTSFKGALKENRQLNKEIEILEQKKRQNEEKVDEGQSTTKEE